MFIIIKPSFYNQKLPCLLFWKLVGLNWLLYRI
jgi:hypothetical protein